MQNVKVKKKYTLHHFSFFLMHYTMSLYLIRHTTPFVEKGTCYGQTDIDVTETFLQEAGLIKELIPEMVEQVYCSPLVRCRKLAEFLFPNLPVTYENSLMEVYCGAWEMQKWDDIPREIIDPWMKDFVNVSFPGGESYIQLHERATQCFEKILLAPRPIAVVTHAGVIRSILSYITQTPLQNSFGVFGLHYGCVVKMDHAEGAWKHELLSTNTSEKEQHKPSYFQRPAKG